MNCTRSLVKGYVTKSTPTKEFDTRTWHKRWCTLCITSVSHNGLIKKKPRSLSNSLKRNSSKRPTTPTEEEKQNADKVEEHVVFSYYYQESDEIKRKILHQFIFDDAKIEKEENIHNFKYAIRVELSTLHAGRILYLCHKKENKDEHERWWTVLNENVNILNDVEDPDDDTSPAVFVPTENNRIQKALREAKEKVRQENEEKTLYSPTQRILSGITDFDISSTHKTTDSGISQCSGTSSQYSTRSYCSTMSGYSEEDNDFHYTDD